VIGGLNGLVGNRLAEARSDLAVGMAVRVAGEDVKCTPRDLRRAFRSATPGIVVFLHGLAETEEWWLRRRPAVDGDDARPYGERLRSDLALTPVYVRYNTGLHISENGAMLAPLLGDLVAGWPVAVERIVAPPPPYVHHRDDQRRSRARPGPPRRRPAGAHAECGRTLRRALHPARRRMRRASRRADPLRPARTPKVYELLRGALQARARGRRRPRHPAAA
jgi:hypothetical protein